MHWKNELRDSIRSVESFLSFLEITEDDLPYDIDINSDFPFVASKFYCSLINKKNHQDPLLKQILTQKIELSLTDGYTTEPLQEAKFTPIPGVYHKYKHRILLIMSAACAINCRYCFRRHAPYSSMIASLKNMDEISAYCNKHSIHEVIMSGGDPLMLSNENIKLWCENLMAIPSVKLLRIHSRLPSVIPSRIDEGLLAVAESLGPRLSLVYHINHPQECHPLIGNAAKKLKDRGTRLYNQSVLLASINDSAKILSELSYQLIDNHIQPYYLHHLDPVHGAAHFEVSMEKGLFIAQEMQSRLPGYLVPKYVREYPGEKSKTHITSLRTPSAQANSSNTPKD